MSAMNVVPQAIQSNVTQKYPDAVVKDVRRWVESIGEFKGNIEMEKCEIPSKKGNKKERKLKKVKNKPSLHAIRGNQGNDKNETNGKSKKLKAPIKKEPKKENAKTTNESKTTTLNNFENLKEQYKNVKLPANWISGETKGRLIFCRIRITSRGSQFDMISDRGIAITNDCMVHVFTHGSKITLNNRKLQKVETIDDIRKTIKAVDGLNIHFGKLPSEVKSPRGSGILNDESKKEHISKTEIPQIKVSGMKSKDNHKTHNNKASTVQK